MREYVLQRSIDLYVSSCNTLVGNVMEDWPNLA